MNKVKLIIELDEEIYNRIKNGYPEPSDCFKCQDEVLNGTPLEVIEYAKSRSVMRRIAIQSEGESNAE